MLRVRHDPCPDHSERMTATRFSGRTVIVTGGGSGIGRVMALGFAAEDAAVVVVDIDPSKAAEVAGEIAQAGGSAVAVHADVSIATDVAAMRSAAADAFRHVD